MKSTLHSLLLERAASAPDGLAYTYLPDRGEPEELTFGELLADAQRLASALLEVGAGGRRVLLPLDRPLGYAAGFFACLLAGALPVSAAPLTRARLAAGAEQLAAIAADCDASFALSSERTAQLVDAAGERSPALRELRWVNVSEPPAGPEAPTPSQSPDDLAYLQYTSGSTGRPRAVALCHRNFLENLEGQRRELSLSKRTRTISWLPQSHDLGLVGPVLQPVHLGSHTVFLSPASFLLRPVRWLEAISEYRGTLSGGPNFGFEMALRRIKDEQREGLDLTSWTHAINASEPIRAETLRRFAEAFAPAGFRPEAFAPSFGMAEATCMVTCGGGPNRLLIRRFDRRLLGQGRAVEVGQAQANGVDFVSCGRPNSTIRVEIVDPDSRRPVPAGEVGEIWLAGASIAGRYFRRQEESEATFGNHLAGDGETRFMRTGDLAFLSDGELFVSGRLKDLIIVRGRNYTPQDIEATAMASHPSLLPDTGAAFPVTTPLGEELGVAQEISSVRGADCEEVTEAIRAAIAGNHGLRPHVVVLLEPGALPKTGSGKVRRSACREAFEEARLQRVLSETVTGADEGA